jgi:hypothetical protein
MFSNLSKTLAIIVIVLLGFVCSVNAQSMPNPSISLIVVDGNEWEGGMNSISPKIIEPFSILQGESAVEKYGEKAKNGLVIVVTTKLSQLDAPLIFVDGEEWEVDINSIISLEGIESVAILKDRASTEKYGEKDKNGVVLITTKK